MRYKINTTITIDDNNTDQFIVSSESKHDFVVTNIQLTTSRSNTASISIGTYSTIVSLDTVNSLISLGALTLIEETAKSKKRKA